MTYLGICDPYNFHPYAVECGEMIPVESDPREPEDTREFRIRVMTDTGIALRDIPDGDVGDVAGGRIICRRGDEFVVAVCGPHKEDTCGVAFQAADLRLVNIATSTTGR